MGFSVEIGFQAQEVIFSRKSKAKLYSLLVLNNNNNNNNNNNTNNNNNNNNVTQVKSQKHLGIILDTRLSFEKDLETVQCKINKTISLVRKLGNLLSKIALIMLYKAFVCPKLDYGDILYDHQQLESLQCDAGLAITEAIIGSSREKLYQ